MALFGGGGPDHPMADIKEAKRLIAELPTGDSVKALEEITFWLDSISRTEGFRSDARFALVDLLDQAAKNHQRKVGQDYLAAQRLQKLEESKLWGAAFEFWKLLGASYNQCIEGFQSGASGAGAIRKQIPAIIARTLRALTLQLKWVLLRYGPIDDRIWGELGRLYHFAEAQRNSMATIEVYPGLHGQSSVRQEFLKAMMLGVSSTDGLNPLELEIAERVVAHFGARYVVQDKPGPGCTFQFDLSMRKPPTRAGKGAHAVGHVRFFGAGDAQQGLAQLIEETRRKDGVPSDVNLGGNSQPKVALDVLEHLALYWSDTPPARRSERRKLTTRLTVAPGFDELLKAMAPAMPDVSPSDAATGGASESWIVENASEGGYGAIIPQVTGDWLRIGALLGVRTETSAFWGAGIIRRISRDEFQQCRVGIQLLSGTTIPVTLVPAGGATSVNGARTERAVLLSTNPDRNDEVGLLLRAGAFNPAQWLQMQVRDKNYLLVPSRVVESGEGFDCAKFQVMGRT